MIVNRKTLTDLDACSDGLEWFDGQKDKELSALVRTAIKEGGESLNYAGWGLCAVMTNEQRVEWAIYCAYQVAHLWKDKHPKEYAIWDEWASGRDRSDAAWGAARDAARGAARAAARDAARDAAWDAARDAAWDAARAAARDAAWGAAWDAARDAAWGAAKDKMLAKLLRKGVAIVYRGGK